MIYKYKTLITNKQGVIYKYQTLPTNKQCGLLLTTCKQLHCSLKFQNTTHVYKQHGLQTPKTPRLFRINKPLAKSFYKHKTGYANAVCKSRGIFGTVLAPCVRRVGSDVLTNASRVIFTQHVLSIRSKFWPPKEQSQPKNDYNGYEEFRPSFKDCLNRLAGR